MEDRDDITGLLARVAEGDVRAADVLLPRVYDALRRLANRYLAAEGAGHTLQATALVHEAYLKLVGQVQANWQGRRHFFAVSAQAIRRILVDHARARGRRKRGGGDRPLTLDTTLVAGGNAVDSGLVDKGDPVSSGPVSGDPVSGDPGRHWDLLMLDDALRRLSEVRMRAAQVVELRFFGGMTFEEMAGWLGVSSRTVRDDWKYARAWLYRELADDRHRHDV